MIKLRNLKRKKGFTLSELIVVVAIIGILISAVAAFGDPVRSMVNDTNARSDTINITKIIGDYIERRVSFAENACIVTNVNAGAASDTNVKDIYDNYKKKVNGKASVGMLVFKYVENDDDPLRSTYKLYDEPITDTSTYSAPTHAVFSDAFYGKYSYFMTVEPYMIETGVPGKYTESVKVNTLKDTPYLDFSIRAYDFKGSDYLDSSIMGKYFGKLRDSSKTDNGIDALGVSRTAFEEVSFAMENIYVSRVSGTGKPIQTGVSYINPTVSGSDIIVFYSVQKYSM